MYNDTIKLLNLEQFNLKIKKLTTTKSNNIIRCYITLESCIINCPSCGNNNIKIHDYQQKKIVHSISTNNPCIIMYNARRYKCKICNNVFYEHNPFSYDKNKLSTYTIFIILQRLKSLSITFKNVADVLFLTPTTVMNVFDQYVEFRCPILPEVICFDEVYISRKTSQKYTFIMADFFKNKIVDICSSRHKNYLTSYFSSISKQERLNVKYTIIDMWDTYRDLSEIYFPNAKIAVDSFHVIKHLNEAMDKIRIKVMKKYDKRTHSLESNDMYYYMLKKFHYFFTKKYEDIYEGKIKIPKMKSKWTKDEIRKYLLYIDNDLSYTYYLKERYREFNLTTDYNTCDEEFKELRTEFVYSHLPEFVEFGDLLTNWKPYIKNSFIRVRNRRLSNGPIEGMNSQIKTIIKAANGYKNFRRFRNRVAYSINKDVPIKGTPIKK